MTRPDYTAVIPVFNSADVVARTVEACARFFEDEQLSYEIIAVDDGSADSSWDVLKVLAAANPHVRAVRLLRNYGQHSAVHCGLTLSRGEYLVTLDDDLQNRPSEIRHLIEKAQAGSDLVFGRFRRKEHSLTRRLGSRVTNRLNAAIFGSPPGLVLTNFKLMHRSVVERILAHRTHSPYINGLAVLYARLPTDVLVEHQPRQAGRSNYGLFRLTAVLARILFGYSALPLRLVAATGAVVAGLSFCFGAYVLARAMLVGTAVPDWAWVAVLLASLNGLTLLMLGMIGEYLVRILQQTGMAEPYHMVEVAGPP